MTPERHLVAEPWADYELLDSGENMKLERYGEVILARPETQALWKKARPELWQRAQAVFAFRDKKGSWEVHRALPEPWSLSWNGARFLARLTGFKHTGVFPEQEPNWEWIGARIRGIAASAPAAEGALPRPPKVLNLFGYTGIASLVAAQAGAQVTHVDASKQSLDWAHENARLSGLPETDIRWMPDDASAFAKRELRRGSSYEGIILDPPAFGRGAKGEVWKIEEDLPVLVEALKGLLSSAPGSFFLMSGYAAGYSPAAFLQLTKDIFGASETEYGELRIQESGGERIVPAGMYVRFVR